MAFLNQTEAESRQADLSDSSVVEDLAADVLQMDALTHMRLQQKLASFMEAAMEPVMVDLAECCLDLHLGRTMCVNLVHKVFNHEATLLGEKVAGVLGPRGLSKLGVEQIILVVEMFKFEEGDTRGLSVLTGEVGYYEG